MKNIYQGIIWGAEGDVKRGLLDSLLLLSLFLSLRYAVYEVVQIALNVQELVLYRTASGHVVGDRTDDADHLREQCRDRMASQQHFSRPQFVENTP